MEDVEDEARNAQRAETEVKAMLSGQQGAGTTTIGFGDSTSSTTTASTIVTKKATDISNLVRKRKTEDLGGEEIKKVKADEGAAGDKENGSMEVATDS